MLKKQEKYELCCNGMIGLLAGRGKNPEIYNGQREAEGAWPLGRCL